MASSTLQIAQDARRAPAIIISQGSFKLMCPWTVRQVKLEELNRIAWLMMYFPHCVSGNEDFFGGNIWINGTDSWHMEPTMPRITWAKVTPLRLRFTDANAALLFHVIPWQGWFSTLSEYFTADCINEMCSWSEFHWETPRVNWLYKQQQGIYWEN